ncbi:MAG: DUF1684 domain-containing protein [Thermoflexibacter sp.]
MKLNQLTYLLVAIVIVAILIYTLSETGDTPQKYIEEIQKERIQKDKDFKNNENISPLTPEDRTKFETLNYFPPDINYKIEADLEVLNEDSVINMLTTTGEKQKYVRYAYAHFSLVGQKLRLTVYKSMERLTKGMLFLPFKDQTNGKETYEAGRYIEVKNTNGSTIMIDFNKAYNPYCAYNEVYSCPITPKENDLPVSILAGEKNYKK